MKKSLTNLIPNIIGYSTFKLTLKRFCHSFSVLRDLLIAISAILDLVFFVVVFFY